MGQWWQVPTTGEKSGRPHASGRRLPSTEKSDVWASGAHSGRDLGTWAAAPAAAAARRAPATARPTAEPDPHY